MNPHTLNASDILAIAAGFGAALILVNLVLSILLTLELREVQRDIAKLKEGHEST